MTDTSNIRLSASLKNLYLLLELFFNGILLLLAHRVPHFVKRGPLDEIGDDDNMVLPNAIAAAIVRDPKVWLLGHMLDYARFPSYSLLDRPRLDLDGNDVSRSRF